jgi:hypothetical protein
MPYQIDLLAEGELTPFTTLEVEEPGIDILIEKGVLSLIKDYVGMSHGIERVIFNDPATIVFFDDGDKIVAKVTDDDEFQPEIGLAMAFMKKLFGSRTAYKNFVKQWVPEEEKEEEVDYRTAIKDMMKIHSGHNLKEKTNTLSGTGV